MKKFLLSFAVTVCLVNHGFSQQELARIGEEYFRSSPYAKPFNAFILHLMSDPTMINKKILKKTDSTLFFLEAEYKSHNPYFFKPAKTKVVFAERQEFLTDSTQPQTIYIYQLITYGTPGAAGLKEVKAEADKIVRRFKKKFWKLEEHDITNENGTTGKSFDFVARHTVFYPFTITWATSRDNTENLMVMTLRFQVFDNEASLPIGTYSF